MRIRLSDPTRLADLRDFFRGPHAIAVVDDDVVDVHIFGGDSTNDARHLDAYLKTWLQLHGRGVVAEIKTVWSVVKIVLVVNERAGDHAAATINDVVAVLSQLGTVAVATPRVPSFAADLNHKTAGADLVVVAGGDGSLNWVVNALRWRLDDVTFALIPLGTGNDLARTLALPRQPVTAAAAIVAGAERQIDYGVATSVGVERLFVNACVGGFPVAVDEALDEKTKDLLGSFAFWVAGIKALPQLERATVTVNGVTVNDCVFAGVGNGRTVGGGFALFPEATLDDGELDACTLAVDDLTSAVRVLASVRNGSHSGLDEVTEQRAARIAIDADPGIEFNVDGELIGLQTPAVFEHGGQLQLRAPAAHVS